MPLCAGIIISDRLPGHTLTALLCASAALLCMTLQLFRKSYFGDNIFGVSIILFLLSSGYLLHHQYIERISSLGSGRQLMTLRLDNSPERKRSSYALSGKILSVTSGDSLTRPEGSIILWLVADTLPAAWLPGDIVSLYVSPAEVKNNGNPCEFDYRRFLLGRGIRYNGFVRPRDIAGWYSPDRRSFRDFSLIVAGRVRERYRDAGLSGDRLALVTALTLGDRQYFEKEQLANFSRAGVMHVMAVSGLHVGMISLFLSFILFFLRGRLKVLKTVIIIICLWCFAFMTGLSPSVLRATIMFSLLQAGTLLNRPAANLNVLLASAFMLAAARPLVIFEAGFQLSYLAMSFIILFYNSLANTFKVKNRLLRWLWQATALSLTAQAGTMALSARLFNIVPLLFLVSNIFIIPLTFIIMSLAFLLVVTSAIPVLPELIAGLLDLFAGMTLKITSTIGSFDSGVITGIGLTATGALLLTLSSALLLAALLRLKSITLRPFIVIFSLFLVTAIMKDRHESRTFRSLSYNIRGGELRAEQQGRILYLYTDERVIPPEVGRHAATMGLKIEFISPSNPSF